jgi:endonuclease YncB( thermonuclease family)
MQGHGFAPIAFAGPLGQVDRRSRDKGRAVAEDAGRPRSRLGIGALAIGLIIIAAIAFIAVNALGDRAVTQVDLAVGKTFPCTVQSVYDGDGPINCTEQDLSGNPVRVRIRGIEARDSDNSCRHPNLCPEASGAEAKAMLERFAVGRLECTSFGPSYNRVDAFCRNARGQDLSCEMLKSRMAVRWEQYDPDGRLLPCVPPAAGGAARR